MIENVASVSLVGALLYSTKNLFNLTIIGIASIHISFALLLIFALPFAKVSL